METSGKACRAALSCATAPPRRGANRAAHAMRGTGLCVLQLGSNWNPLLSPSGLQLESRKLHVTFLVFKHCRRLPQCSVGRLHGSGVSPAGRSGDRVLGRLGPRRLLPLVLRSSPNPATTLPTESNRTVGEWAPEHTAPRGPRGAVRPSLTELESGRWGERGFAARCPPEARGQAAPPDGVDLGRWGEWAPEHTAPRGPEGSCSWTEPDGTVGGVGFRGTLPLRSRGGQCAPPDGVNRTVGSGLQSTLPPEARGGSVSLPTESIGRWGEWAPEHCRPRP